MSMKLEETHIFFFPATAPQINEKLAEFNRESCGIAWVAYCS